MVTRVPRTARGSIRWSKGIDLAVLKVPGLKVRAVLPLAPLALLNQGCTIPGWSNHGKAYSGDCLSGSVHRCFPYQEPQSALVARAYDLKVTGGEFQKGHSGAPAICNRTGAVFAVVATREDQGGSSGSAICISYLRNLWPDMPEPLRTALSQCALGPDFEQELAALFTALFVAQPGLGAPQIRALCRRSAPPVPPLELPDGESAAGLLPWLLDRPLFDDGRHPLYDILADLRARPGLDAPLCARIDAALRRLKTYYGPDLKTDPLPPPPAAAVPALVEIVFELLGGSEFRDYEVHSHWHPSSGGPPQAGPACGREAGGRLDLRARDQVLGFVCDLCDAVAAVAAAAADTVPLILFQFRVPHALLLHPFEQWPQDQTGVALGHDYPVVVAARERRGAMLKCLERWDQLRAHLHEPLCHCRWCPETPEVPADQALLNHLDARVAAAPCVVLARTPDPTDPHPRQLLTWLLARGVPVALWPRAAAAEPGLCDCLDRELGATAVADLPFALRDRRRQAAGQPDAHPLWAHLTLLWDDPRRSVLRPASFHRGLG